MDADLLPAQAPLELPLVDDQELLDFEEAPDNDEDHKRNVLANQKTQRPDPPLPPEEKQTKFSGKRKIIQRGWDDDYQPPHRDKQQPRPPSPDEIKRREARAAKFGIAVNPASPMSEPASLKPEVFVTADQVGALEQRAKKFGVKPNNPLDLIVGSSGSDAFWEDRRDAAADDEERLEAIYAFGTDNMSTKDLLHLFSFDDMERPSHVEWINDSSANICFATSETAEAALTIGTCALFPGATSTDAWTWRTLPLERASAGKGLQLIFRRATLKDVKPPRRTESRWYGESRGGAKRSRLHDKRGPKRHGEGGLRAQKRPAGPTLAEMVRAAHVSAGGEETLGEYIDRKNLPDLATKMAETQLPDLASKMTSA